MNEIDPVLYYRMRETVSSKGDILAVAWKRLDDPPENSLVMPISSEIAARFLTQMEPTINWEIVQGLGKHPILKRISVDSTSTNERIVRVSQPNPDADVIIEKHAPNHYILKLGDNVDVERHGSVVLELALCDYMRPQVVYGIARVRVSDVGDGVRIFGDIKSYGGVSVYTVRYFDSYGFVDAYKRY